MRGTGTPPDGRASTTRRKVVLSLAALALIALVAVLGRASTGQRSWQPSASPAGESEAADVPGGQAGSELSGRKTLDRSLLQRAAAQADAVALGRRLLGVRRREQHRRPRHRRRRRPGAREHDLRRLGGRRRLEEHRRRARPTRPPGRTTTRRRSARSRAAPTARSGPAPARRTPPAAASPTSATASTSRPTAAPPGRTSASATPGMIGRIAVDPADPNIVLVAAAGSIYSTGGKRGLYRTIDGGDHWAPSSTPDLDAAPYTGVVDVAIDPVNPNRVYATAVGPPPHRVPAALRRHRLGPLRHRQRAGDPGRRT